MSQRRHYNFREHIWKLGLFPHKGQLTRSMLLWLP
jgi:hypothetical protein